MIKVLFNNGVCELLADQSVQFVAYIINKTQKTEGQYVNQFRQLSSCLMLKLAW